MILHVFKTTVFLAKMLEGIFCTTSIAPPCNVFFLPSSLISSKYHVSVPTNLCVSCSVCIYNVRNLLPSYFDRKDCDSQRFRAI